MLQPTAVDLLMTGMVATVERWTLFVLSNFSLIHTHRVCNNRKLMENDVGTCPRSIG